MKNKDKKNRPIFSITVNDVNSIARQMIGRNLTNEELSAFEKGFKITDYLDWQGAIETIISEVISDAIIEDTSKLNLYDRLDEEDDDYEEIIIYR